VQLRGRACVGCPVETGTPAAARAGRDACSPSDPSLAGARSLWMASSNWAISRHPHLNRHRNSRCPRRVSPPRLEPPTWIAARRTTLARRLERCHLHPGSASPAAPDFASLGDRWAGRERLAPSASTQPSTAWHGVCTRRRGMPRKEPPQRAERAGALREAPRDQVAAMTRAGSPEMNCLTPAFATHARAPVRQTLSGTCVGVGRSFERSAAWQGQLR